MSDIHIHREHPLSLQQARQIGLAWAQKAREKLDLACTYEEGDAQDILHFSRPGVQGTLRVDSRQFEIKAELGFLMSAFKDRIEAKIAEQFDELLDTAPRPDRE